MRELCLLCDGVYQLWSLHLKRYSHKLGMQNHMELQLSLKYKTVACIYMLSDVLHIVAKL